MVDSGRHWHRYHLSQPVIQVQVSASDSVVRRRHGGSQAAPAAAFRVCCSNTSSGCQTTQLRLGSESEVLMNLFLMGSC
jgi:hypothetical protein